VSGLREPVQRAEDPSKFAKKKNKHFYTDGILSLNATLTNSIPRPWEGKAQTASGPRRNSLMRILIVRAVVNGSGRRGPITVESLDSDD